MEGSPFHHFTQGQGLRTQLRIRYPALGWSCLLLVSEPDPRKIRKVGLGDRLGRKCILRPECRRASDWFMSACQRERNPIVQFKETELQAREVVGAQISFHWAHGRLEVPEIK